MKFRTNLNFSLNFFFKDFIYLFMREREREIGRDIGREPNVGLNPWTPGSYRGSKAGAKPLSHPGIPFLIHF